MGQEGDRAAATAGCDFVSLEEVLVGLVEDVFDPRLWIFHAPALSRVAGFDFDLAVVRDIFCQLFDELVLPFWRVDVGREAERDSQLCHWTQDVAGPLDLRKAIGAGNGEIWPPGVVQV